MSRLGWAVLIYFGATLFTPLLAHEVRPGYLQIEEVDNQQYDVLWKVPALGDKVLSINPTFDPGCEQLAPPSAYMSSDGARVSHWTMACNENGLDGLRITIEGLATTMIDVLVHIQLANGNVVSQILRPADSTFSVDVSGNNRPLLGYITLGIEHILSGIDHLLFVLCLLLFVLCLLLIVRGKWLLVKTITAFTVAHSITLAAATLGWVNVSQAPVEAVIALSILFLACELVKRGEQQPTLTQRFPWVVAFIFGLLHGFGFAGALRDVGLPQSDIPTALLMFNVGVELGQLMFVAAVIGLGWAAKRAMSTNPKWTVQATAYGVGSVSAFWMVERIMLIIR